MRRSEVVDEYDRWSPIFPAHVPFLCRNGGRSMISLSLSKPLTSLLFSTILSLAAYRSVAMHFSYFTNQSRNSLPHYFPQSIWSCFPSRSRCGWRRVISSAFLSSSTLLFIWIRFSPRGLLNIQYSNRAWAKKINCVRGNRRISLTASPPHDSG